MERILVVVTSLTALASGQLLCKVPGEIVEGDFNKLTRVKNYNSCLNECKNAKTCFWFTFLGDVTDADGNYDCFLFETKGTIEESCSNCFSGQKDCLVELTCKAPGYCSGVSLTTPTVKNEDDCIKACFETPDCSWYSFFPATGRCYLLKTCETIEDDCNDSCTYGEKACYRQGGTIPTKLIAVGGGKDLSRRTVELVDLSGAGKSCQLGSYPYDIINCFGVFLKDQAVVCGGYSQIAVGNECFTYNVSQQTWKLHSSMLISRTYAAAAIVSDYEFLVTGGGVSTAHKKAELMSVTDGSVGLFVDIPEPKSGHNLVYLGDNQFAIVGGSQLSQDVWVLDYSTETYRRLPDIPEESGFFQAGMVKYPNGTSALIVAGGVTFNFCYSLNLNTELWQPCTPMPDRITSAANVPYGDTFLIVGGGGDVAKADFIYMFDVNTDDWVLLPQKLMFERTHFAAFLVPDDFVSCPY